MSEILDGFLSEAQCVSLLLSAVYPSGIECAGCGEPMGLLKTRPVFICDNCKKQKTIRDGLFCEGSRLALHKWFRAVELLDSDISISNAEMSKLLNVQRTSARRIKERIIPLLMVIQEQHQTAVLSEMKNKPIELSLCDSNIILIRAILKLSEQEVINYFTSTHRYKIICGNCYEVLPRLPALSVDLICTDAPYNKGMEEWDVAVDYKLLAREFSRLVTDGGAVVIFCSLEQIGKCLKAFSSFFPCYQQFIYEKNDASNIHVKQNRFAPTIENALIFWKNSRHTFNAKSPAEKRNSYKCSRASVKERSDCGGHRTPKPLALMKHLITVLSSPSDTVLDPFMGSGTSGVASVELGRRFIGVELSPIYCEVSAKRLKACYKKRTSEAGGEPKV